MFSPGSERDSFNRLVEVRFPDDLNTDSGQLEGWFRWRSAFLSSTKALKSIHRGTFFVEPAGSTDSRDGPLLVAD